VKLFYYLFHTFELLLVHAYESDSMIMLCCPNVYFYKTIEIHMEKIQTQMIKLLELMEKYGANFGAPHITSMSNGLFEIRVKVQEGIGWGLVLLFKCELRANS